MVAEFLSKTEFLAGGIALIPLLPLAGFLLNSLGWLFMRDRWPRMMVYVIAVGTVAASFALAVNYFLWLHANPDSYISFKLFDWLWAPGLEFQLMGEKVAIGSVLAPFELVFDRLSAVMCLVVTGVGGLIHLYSTGYMSHDKSYTRFFAYLNLFTFAMLMLVMGKNIMVMFLGWEGVGLCSYLLIGFWYEGDDNATAGKKAFVVNRVGDFGFLIGIFTILWFTGTLGSPTLDFYGMAEVISNHSEALKTATLIGVPVATLIGLSLFLGATGKSAQIPLYVWLPDAMAGPTPVSALIHAATMVTAGVYMIGRLNFIYLFSPTALMVVALVGVCTAFFAATIGLTQNDIKKVLAYSTVSQLGYMFTAMGVGAYAVGIFHLTTHAFFKALLFLGAGSVIHGMSNEQDMRKMGGLKKYMPITFWTMAMAWLAIAGIIPFAGFFSKDEILWRAFSTDLHPEKLGLLIYGIGLVTAVMTAVYMSRLMMMTFLTPSRIEPEVEHHVHESPWTMWVPLAVLAVLSVGGGFMNVPHALGGNSNFSQWLSPMWAHETAVDSHLADAGHGDAGHGDAGHGDAGDAVRDEHGAAVPAGDMGHGNEGHGNEGHGDTDHAGAPGHGGGHGHVDPIEYVLMALSVGLALLAIAGTWILYSRRMEKTKALAENAGALYEASLNKYWVDEIYEATIIQPIKRLSYFVLFRIVDVNIIDGIVNGIAGLTKAGAERGRKLQDGVVGTYAFFIVLGLLAILTYFFGLR